jgi:hypothetical protein
MSKWAVCDNCGEKDDWSIDGRPFFNGGANLQLRDESGSEEFDHTLEVCPNCRELVLKQFPKLKEATERI